MVEASAAGLPMKKDYIGFSNDRALLSLVGSGKLSENTIRPRSLTPKTKSKSRCAVESDAS